MTDTIELTETSRLRIEVDQDAQCPRGDWDMLTGFVKIQGRGDSRRSDVPAVHDDPTGRIPEAWDAAAYDRVAAEVVTRWAKIFHGLHLEYDAEHGGFWFVDGAGMAENWPELQRGTPEFAAKEAEIIESEQKVYETWAEGEVYGVILERRVDWARIDGNGEMVFLTEPHTMHTWEEAEALWGCYLDDEYTAQVVAKEHFDLTDDEEDAL